MNLTADEIEKIDRIVVQTRESLIEIAGLRAQIKAVYDEINEMRSKNAINVITDEIAGAQKRVDALYTKKAAIEAVLFNKRRELNIIVEYTL